MSETKTIIISLQGKDNNLYIVLQRFSYTIKKQKDREEKQQGAIYWLSQVVL